MAYNFLGRLCGYICKDCPDWISNAKIRIYQVAEQQQQTVLATADPKFTLHILTDKEIKEKKARLISETTSDNKGKFAFHLDSKDKYNGEAFEIDVLLESNQSLQFTITTLQPQWRQTENGFVWAWDYCISARHWCLIRQRLGSWTICGKFTHCETKQPLPNVRVLAFDRDWLQDDALGTAITDDLGRFRIDYTEEDFKPGTFIDIELFGGPDIYFRVETIAGSPLLTELPSRGRDPDRENVGPCFCVNLCAEHDPIIDDDDPYPVFTHVGSYHYASTIHSTPGTSGLTISDGRAFYASNRLNGILAKKLNNQPMEYQFEFQQLNSAGIAITPWQVVTPGMINRTVIGIFEKNAPDSIGDPNPIKSKEYTVNGTVGPNELVASIVDGWVRVPQESGVFSASGHFQANGNMIRLDSNQLASFNDVDLTGLLTGNSSTSTGKALVENSYFAIRMKIREVGDLGSGVVAGVCQNIAINNTLYDNMTHHPAWMSQVKSDRLSVAMVDINQLIVGGGCSEIDDTLDVLFTAAHPTLGNVSISMTGPGGPYSFTLPAPGTPGDHFGTAAPNFVVADLNPCAYIVTLSVQTLLTTGDSIPHNPIDQIAFCKA